jgi:hypothetical protein
LRKTHHCTTKDENAEQDSEDFSHV